MLRIRSLSTNCSFTHCYFFSFWRNKFCLLSRAVFTMSPETYERTLWQDCVHLHALVCRPLQIITAFKIATFFPSFPLSSLVSPYLSTHLPESPMLLYVSGEKDSFPMCILLHCKRGYKSFFSQLSSAVGSVVRLMVIESIKIIWLLAN